MQEQISKNNKLFIGMDLHKNSSTFCAKDCGGKLVASEKVLTDRNDVGRFINSLKKNGDDLSLVMEPVSQWYYCTDFIESLGVDIHLTHPMKVKAIASAKK